MSGNNGHIPILTVPHEAATGPTRREPLDRYDAGGAIVRTARVELARGTRYEVTAEHDAIDKPITDEHGRVTDPGGPVRRVDVLWLRVGDDAARLARAAAARLSAGTFEGLTPLADELHIERPEHA